MAFIEPMHRNKPNITYLLTRLQQGKSVLGHCSTVYALKSLVFLQVRPSLGTFVCANSGSIRQLYEIEGNSPKMVISDGFGLMDITDHTSFPSGYLYN